VFELEEGGTGRKSPEGDILAIDEDPSATDLDFPLLIDRF